MADVQPTTRATSTRKPSPSKATATPPEPTGVLLAAIPRGRAEELRLSLDSFNGHEYIAVRVWTQDRNGAWWPTKAKGCSIRLGELAGVIQALQLAADVLDANPVED